MLQTILSIAGKPGLYKLVSRGKMNLIVESLDETHKRQPAFGSDRVTSLADIAMFTESDDVPLGEVLAKVRDKEEGKVASLNWRKASAKELQDYFAEVLLTSIATVYTQVTSRNSFSGMKSSLKQVLLTLRKI